MTEGESNHRRAIEMLAVQSNIKVRSRGQVFAFILAMAVVVGGMVLIALGKSAEGLTALVAAVGGLAATFLYKIRRNGNGNGAEGADE